MDKFDCDYVTRKGALISDGHVLIDSSKVEVAGRLLTKLNAAMLTAERTEGGWRNDKFQDTAPDLARYIVKIEDTTEAADTCIEFQTTLYQDVPVMARVFIANAEVWGMDTKFHDQFRGYNIRWAGDKFAVFTITDELLAVIMPVRLFDLLGYSGRLAIDDDNVLAAARLITGGYNAWVAKLEAERQARMAEADKAAGVVTA